MTATCASTIGSSAKTRWADISGSDGEASEEDEDFTLSASDGSSQEAPEPALEHAHRGLNLVLIGATRLGAGPQSFDLTPPAPAADACDAANWQPNAKAPEFIPTLSMDCPLVGVCHVIPEDPEDDEARETVAVQTTTGARLTPPALPAQVFDMMTPRVPGIAEHFDLETPRSLGGWTTPSGTPRARGASDGSHSKAGVAEPLSSEKEKPAKARRSKHRTSSGLKVKVPDTERSTSERVLRALSDGISTTASDEGSADREQSERCSEVGSDVGSSPARSGGGLLPRAGMPDATEEEWLHRFDMRRKSVEVGKETPEYRRYEALVSGAERSPSRPQTPDPMDRSVSKRQWKYDVHCWRTQVKEYLAEADRRRSGGRATAETTQ